MSEFQIRLSFTSLTCLVTGTKEEVEAATLKIATGEQVLLIFLFVHLNQEQICLLLNFEFSPSFDLLVDSSRLTPCARNWL